MGEGRAANRTFGAFAGLAPLLFLDCEYANVNADHLRRGSGVWFNRRDSKSREPLWLRGFESPPLRHAKHLI